MRTYIFVNSSELLMLKKLTGKNNHNYLNKVIIILSKCMILISVMKKNGWFT